MKLIKIVLIIILACLGISLVSSNEIKRKDKLAEGKKCQSNTDCMSRYCFNNKCSNKRNKRKNKNKK